MQERGLQKNMENSAVSFSVPWALWKQVMLAEMANTVTLHSYAPKKRLYCLHFPPKQRNGGYPFHKKWFSKSIRGGSVACVVTRCERLYIYGRFYANHLFGKIPDAMVCMTQMSDASQRANWLSGKIPEGMASMMRLVEMHFNSNRLSGKMPDAMVSMSRLTWMIFCNNWLSGKISRFCFRSPSYGRPPFAPAL